MNMTMNGRKWWFWVIFIIVLMVLLYLVRSILLPFVVGVMAAYFLDPAADWLEKRRCSRTTATAIITISFFAVVALVVLALAPVLYDQFTGLMRTLPAHFTALQQLLTPYVEKAFSYVSTHPVEEAKEAIGGASASIFDVVRKFVLGLFASGVAIANLLMLIFLTPVVTFYLLREWDHIVDAVDNLLPRDSAETIRGQMRLIDDAIAGYLRGQLNVCLLLCVYYVIALGLAGLKYGVLVGLMAGTISFIPFVGALLSLTVGITLAVFQFENLFDIVAVAAVFGAGLILENNILVPKLIGEKVGLHPAWVIFGMLAGGVLLGFVGVLLAVPITAVIGVLVRFAASRYRESAFYMGENTRKAKTIKDINQKLS